jgi:hypothetical protein
LTRDVSVVKSPAATAVSTMFSCIVSSIVVAAGAAVVAAPSDEESSLPHPATARPTMAKPSAPTTRADRIVPSFFICVLLCLLLVQS